MTLLARAAAAVDAAVLLRLGLVSVDPLTSGAVAADVDRFWDAARLQHPPALEPAPVRPGPRLRRLGVRALDLTGPSEGPGGHAGSRRLHARAYLRHGAAPHTPLVLLLHGFAAPVPVYEDHHARRLLVRGVHAARLDLPYHLRRRPGGGRAGDGFFSTDVAHTAAVLRQSVEDAAAVVAWARSELRAPVGVIGFSLGGLVACLLAACVALESVVAVTPPADLPELILERAPRRVRRRLGLDGTTGGPWARDAAEARRVLGDALAPVTPRRLAARTDPDRVVLVAAAEDRIVGAPAVEALARTWGAELWTYPQGHVTVMSARGISRRIHDRVLRDAGAAVPGGMVTGAGRG